MKKAYLIGLIITLSFMAIRFIVLFSSLSLRFVFGEFFLTLFIMHAYLGLAYVSIHIPRYYYQEWFLKRKIAETWIIHILLSIILFVVYLSTLTNVDQHGFFLYGGSMFIIGAWMESIQHKAYHDTETIDDIDSETMKEYKKKILKDQDQHIKF